MAFLSGYLLSGLVLAAVPIIIHLLNRRRFLLVDWAPMKYLKLTIQVTRRRLKLEQWLLLAVRTLAILVLILAVARPVLSPASLGAWLGARSRTTRILVIDDSLSMGYRAGQHSAMELARQVAAELIQRVGAQDSLTVLTTSAPDVPLVRDAYVQDSAKLLRVIGDLTPTATASDWAGSLRAVDRVLQGSPFPVREVTVITDMRRFGWSDEVTEISRKLSQMPVKLTVIDVGSRRTENLALLALEQEDRVALPGTPMRLHALVRNDQEAAVSDAVAVLTAGGESRPLRLPPLLPGAVTQIPLTVTPSQPGPYMVQLALPGDALIEDDRRWLGLSVRPQLELALVDGDPSSQPFQGATDFLAAAFSVGTEPWQVRRGAEADWFGAPADVLVLANVATISPAQRSALEAHVRAGLGLMIFAGDQVDPQSYNDQLYRDGAGLLPGRLERVIDEPATGLVVEPLDDSPLALLAKLAPAVLAQVHTNRYMAVALPPEHTDQVRVLARWNDPEGHPAVLEKRVGRARVLFWTMSANRQWTDWPTDPTYVLAVRAAALAAARADPRDQNLTAGEPIRYTLEKNQAVTDAKILAPGDDAPQPVQLAKSPDGQSELRYADTRRAGTYTLTWNDSFGRAQSYLYCVNPDPAESDLRTISDADVRQLLGPLNAEVIHAADGHAPTVRKGTEIWRTLATAVLVILAVESLLAVWVGRER